MSLRRKTLLAVGIVILGIMLLTGGFTFLYMQESYRGVEQALVEQDVSRAMTAIENDEADLSATLRDYADGNEIYQYAQGRNPQWKTTNIQEPLFQLDNTQYILIFNTSGALIDAECFDQESRKISPASGAFVKDVRQFTAGGGVSDRDVSTTGIVNSSEGLVIIASHPILRDDGSGPAGGMLVMAKRIDSGFGAELSRTIGENVTILGPADRAAVPVLMSMPVSGPADRPFVVPLNQSAIAGLARIPASDNSTGAFLQVTVPRTVYQNGLANMVAFLVILSAGGLFITLVILILVDVVIISRVNAILGKIRGRNDPRDPPGGTGAAGDEITELGNAIDPVFTQLDESKRTLKESEQRFSTIFAAVQVGLILVDATEHTILQANPKALELIGAGADRVVGSGCHRFILPAEPGTFPVSDPGLAMNSSEKILVTGDRQQIPVIMTVVPARIGGRPVLVESFFDISGLKRAEDALRKSEERFRRIADNAPDIIFRMSLPGGEFEYISPAVETITGYPPEAHHARSLLTLPYFSRDARSGPLKDTWDQILNGTVPPVSEFRITTKNGETRWLHLNGVIVRDECDRPVALEGIVRDITGRKQAADALERSNRKLNLMSCITRHDIQNQITALMGYQELIDDSLEPDSPLKPLVQNIGKMAETIGRLLEFTRDYQSIGIRAPQWNDMHYLVIMARARVNTENLRITDDLSDLYIYADPLIDKVIWNLIENAIRHGGGVKQIHFSWHRRAADLVFVCQDDGIGIPEAEKSLIFENGAGKHTGLGLFFMREILDITGMTIRETGRCGSGARFEILVPDGHFRFGEP